VPGGDLAARTGLLRGHHTRLGGLVGGILVHGEHRSVEGNVVGSGGRQADQHRDYGLLLLLSHD
jgi:hypothetical protein